MVCNNCGSRRGEWKKIGFIKYKCVWQTTNPQGPNTDSEPEPRANPNTHSHKQTQQMIYVSSFVLAFCCNPNRMSFGSKCLLKSLDKFWPVESLWLHTPFFWGQIFSGIWILKIFLRISAENCVHFTEIVAGLCTCSTYVFTQHCGKLFANYYGKS